MLVRQIATMQLVSVLTILLTITNIQCQLWSTPQDFLNNFNWFRQARSKTLTTLPNTETTTSKITTIDLTTRLYPTMTTTTILNQNDPTLTTLYSKMMQKLTDPTTTLVTEKIATTTDSEEVTLDFQDNARIAQHIHTKFEKVQTKTPANISQNLLPLPAGAENVLVKPTKYHYYPHNQHIYLLPECAIQQVCNAVYVRLNWTQPLCACPNRYRDPCSASLNSDDLHTTELITDPSAKRALTLVKTCEPTAEMRLCRTPRDWSLLALQNIRTGKSHYLVICRCPETNILEGPMSHDQPAYASVPGIRVYGMLCSTTRRRGRPLRTKKSFSDLPPFPWEKVKELVKTTSWD